MDLESRLLEFVHDVYFQPSLGTSTREPGYYSSGRRALAFGFCEVTAGEPRSAPALASWSASSLPAIPVCAET